MNPPPEDKSKQMKPIPTRFDERTRRRLAEAAKVTGLPCSQVIRLGVLLVLPQIEGGTVTLPKSTAA